MKSIIAFGDSITFGRFDHSAGGRVGRLKKYFEDQDSYHAVYNQGVPGDTSRGLLQRIDVECKARAKYVWEGDKHIILIAIGINDSRGIDAPENVDVPLTDYEKNVQEILSIARKHSTIIVVIGITPVDEDITNPFENTYFTNEKIEEYNEMLKTICKNQQIPFVDVYSEMKSKEYNTLLADGVHPNYKGYDLLYKIIRKKLIIKKAIK
ncbi:hypothetical protein GF342_02420 [Candidatus Woesearchaeota archaeon]|nr:hypothetical protein [Candidatus Woesearchaeota archaeon]